MKSSYTPRNLRRLIALCVALCAFAALPLLSSARSENSINIVNNSNRQIRNVFLSHVDLDDWGTDQLGESIIMPGQSFTISNVSWDAAQIKVIGEDQDGCFLSTVVASGSNVGWTITNATVADCGQ